MCQRLSLRIEIKPNLLRDYFLEFILSTSTPTTSTPCQPRLALATPRIGNDRWRETERDMERWRERERERERWRDQKRERERDRKRERDRYGEREINRYRYRGRDRERE